MGTRADFYVGRGPDAEWLGSIAWDGYPDGITPKLGETTPARPGGPGRHKAAEWPNGGHFFAATTEEEYRERLERFFAGRNDVTRPASGWPWPWDDSGTTDYAYAFDGGKVWASGFGGEWFDPLKKEPEDAPETAVFPNMRACKNVAWRGPRSGLAVVGPNGVE